ncbi:MAG: Lrp/AsnC ligand binding domain-containing protein [Candidatus Hecatellaceae archaeon]|mgnify:CR=1 FL=1|nr:MAG: hypothetical protein DRO43_01080 [Candidatus Hecatellales archaeon]
MRACILVRTEPKEYKTILKRISKLSGVSFAFPALGRTDIVAKAEVEDLKGLTELVLSIGKMSGVVATETLIGMEG